MYPPWFSVSMSAMRSQSRARFLVGILLFAVALLSSAAVTNVHAGRSSHRATSTLQSQDVLHASSFQSASLAEALSSSSTSMSIFALVSRIISSTSLKDVIRVQNPDSIVVPLLGEIRLPDETVHLEKTITTSVHVAGVKVGLSLSLDSNSGFQMVLKLSNALPGQTLSSALSVALGSGNNAFLTKLLDALPLDGAELAIESSCSVQNLLQEGSKSDCAPSLSIVGGGEIKQSEGDLPALGKVQYRVVVSRQAGLSLSISAPELNNKKIDLVPGVGSIRIAADSIQVSIGSDLIGAFLDRVLQVASPEKKSSLLLAERNSVQDAFVQAWSLEKQATGIQVGIKGSIAVELLQNKFDADVDMQFDSSSGSIAFSAKVSKHPDIKISGVSLLIVKVSFSSANREFSIAGQMNLFGIRLVYEAKIQKPADQPFNVKAYVNLDKDHGDWDLASILNTKLPGMLESMRITSFMGEVDISSKELILLVAIKGEVVDNVAFSLDLGLRKETGKRPIVTARFFPTLEKPLPVFELMSSLNSISVLNEIKLVSFELNPFNVTAEGHFEFQISSVISLFGSHIQLDGSYNGGDKTFSFSASTRNDTKPILLSNLVPAFASIPVAKDVRLESFTFKIDKLAGFKTPKFDIEATGSVRALQIKIHTVFGGDAKSPSFSIETTKKPSKAVDGAGAINFLDGLPIKGFTLAKLSASLLDGTLTFSLEGGIMNGLLQYNGKLVLNTRTKSGSLDARVFSPDESGVALPEMLTFLKNVPFADKIALVSGTLVLHREKDEGFTGSLNMKTQMWKIPVDFAASISSERVTFSVSSDAGAEEGVLLSNHIPEISRIEGLKSLKLNSFSLQAEKDLKAKAFTASLNGKGEIFEVNAEFKLEYAAAGIQATFDAKANDDAGVKLSTHLPWLKNIPVLKDIRFISAHLVAELTKDPSTRQLFINAKGALMAVEVSVSATLNSETKTVSISAKPTEGRNHVPLSELIPLKGFVSELLGNVKLIQFSFTASLAGKSNDNDSVKSRLQLSLTCDLKLFGADFSGSFQYASQTPSFSVALGKKDADANVKLSQISPSLKSFTQVIGDIVIKQAKISYANKLFELRGMAAVFGVDVALRLDINLNKDIFFSGTATSSKGVITLSNLVPSLKDNKIFNAFGVQEVKISLNKTGSSTAFSIQGSARLFNVPVSASFTMGTGGRVELKVFTPPGHVITLKSIVPQVSGVPVLDSLGLKDLLLKFSKASSNDSPKVTIGGAVTILGISLRIDVIISSKGVTIAGEADFSKLKDAKGFLGIVASVCHKVGVVVTTYTHRSPQLNNQELPKGAVAVYGVVNPTGPFKKITEIVDKVTGKKDGVSGLRLTGIISPDITKCSFSIEMPGISFSLGQKGSLGASVILQFQGLGPTFALKFKLSIKLDKADIDLVAAISIRLPSFVRLSGSMVGRWSEPFGLKNTYIENLAVQAGIKIPKGPYPPIPSEFGFMGTVFVSPIRFSIAIAVALDGGVLVSSSLNVLSMQAVLGVGRTLGIPIPASADNHLPKFTLHDLRIYICSRPMTIGEFSFTMGLQFSAGIKVNNFAGYVSLSVNPDGIELFGAMSRLQLGKLIIDRPASVKIPPEVSRLGPATQSLPKEINSISEVKKVSAMLSLAQMDEQECHSRNIHHQCKQARSIFTESMLSPIYSGPVIAASLSKKSQILFFTGRIRLLNNVIQIHCHLSLKKFEFKFHLRLFNVLAIDFEAGANVATMSNIRVKADIRVKDLREEILKFMRNLFGIQQAEKKRNMDAKAARDAEAARKRADGSARQRYEACIRRLPAHLRNNQHHQNQCARVLMVEMNPILVEVIAERVSQLQGITNLPSEIVAYRDALSSIFFERVHESQKENALMLAESSSSAKWGVFRRIVHAVRHVVRRVVHVVKKVVNFVVQLTKKALDFVKRVAQAAWNAVKEAAKRAWDALKRGLFALVKALLDAFWMNRAWFNADIGSLTNPGTVSGGVSVRVRSNQYNWSFHLNLKNPLEVIKSLGRMVWNAVRQIAKWF